MGKHQSKAQCFILNPNLSQTPMDKVWEEKSKFDWTNCNLDETLSELSISLEDATASSPLRVDLPPPKPETETSKVLKLDHLTTNENDNTKGSESKFNLEKFECGVQFESSENAKQEWSFTLYNFDGHGGITKEDLASLLRALYDAVGSSIKLPPKGVKTLKLHLSVGQDSAAELKAVAKPESRERSRNTNNLEKAGRNKVKDFSKLNNFKWTSVKCTNEKQPGLMDSCLSPVPEQQQLAELVMENMERNQIKQLRRHHENHHHHKHGHQNISQCPVTIATTGEYGVNLGQKIDQSEEQPKESQDRRNYYLDLAGVENISPKFQNNPTVPVAGSGYVHSRREAQRSRPHNIAKCDNLHSVANKCDNFPIMCTDKRDNVAKETERLRCKQSNGERRNKYRQCHEPRSKSFDLHRVPKKNRPLSAPQHQQRPKELNSKCFQPLDSHAHDLLTISPHHHRKHGHREKDHELAMKQVAQWIKREHAAHLARDQPIIQRHEHRHVHEHHHHHHYHHYHET